MLDRLRHSLLLSAVALTGGAGCATVLDTSRALATVPYHQAEDGRVIIAAQVNGTGPHRFAIDTAASRSVIFEALREELGLPLQREVMVQGMIEAGLFPLTRITQVGIGATAWNDTDMVVLPGTVPSAAVFDGILGLDFLRHFTVVFDTGTEKMSLYDPADVDQAAYQGWAAVPLEQRRVGNSGRTFYFAELRLGKKYVPAVVDLGAGFNVLNWPAAQLMDLSPARLRRHDADEISGALGSTPDVFRVSIDTVGAGVIEWQREPFIIGDLPVFSALTDATQPTAILGAELFLRRDLVLDFAHSRLLIDSAGRRRPQPRLIDATVTWPRD